MAFEGIELRLLGGAEFLQRPVLGQCRQHQQREQRDDLAPNICIDCRAFARPLPKVDQPDEKRRTRAAPVQRGAWFPRFGFGGGNVTARVSVVFIHQFDAPAHVGTFRNRKTVLLRMAESRRDRPVPSGIREDAADNSLVVHGAGHILMRIEAAGATVVFYPFHLEAGKSPFIGDIHEH